MSPIWLVFMAKAAASTSATIWPCEIVYSPPLALETGSSEYSLASLAKSSPARARLSRASASLRLAAFWSSGIGALVLGSTAVKRIWLARTASGASNCVGFSS